MYLALILSGITDQYIIRFTNQNKNVIFTICKPYTLRGISLATFCNGIYRCHRRSILHFSPPVPTHKDGVHAGSTRHRFRDSSICYFQLLSALFIAQKPVLIARILNQLTISIHFLKRNGLEIHSIIPRSVTGSNSFYFIAII